MYTTLVSESSVRTTDPRGGDLATLFPLILLPTATLLLDIEETLRLCDEFRRDSGLKISQPISADFGGYNNILTCQAVPGSPPNMFFLFTVYR